MAKSKLNKKIPELVSSFENILVCNNKQLRPFVEIFVFEPENVTQKNLGTLMGVFEINDTSEDSSYVVNYLSSVIKKEYFSKPKRAPIESFEAALHRGNLALSKIAEHGNVKWIGKLNAIIAIIEKNNLHLSQAGTASALLLRAKGLTDISEDLSPTDSDLHPLKTFINVSSGRLEAQDKLIVTTAGMFEIFSLEEVKKSALRFSGEKFIQFLKTALGSELEKAAVLVVDIQEKTEAEPVATTRKDKTLNAFSQSAFFREPAPSATNTGKLPPEKVSAEMTQEIADEINTGKEEFINEKSGHIYIKGTMEESLNIKPPVDYLAIFNRQLGAAHSGVKRISKSSGLLLLNAARRISLPKISLPKINLPARSASPARHADESRAGWHSDAGGPAKKVDAPKPIAKITTAETIPKIALRKAEPTAPGKNYAAILAAKAQEIFSAKNKGRLLNFLQQAWDKTKNAFVRLLPDFTKIKKITGQLDYQQRIYAIVIVLLIFVVPLLGLRINAYIQSRKPQPVAPVVEVIVPPLSQDKNVTRIENLNAVYSDSNINTVINLNDKFFAVSQTQIADLQTAEKIAIPADFGQIKFALGMDDLNLLFLINADNKIISFSPVPKKFQTNTLTVPASADVKAAGTYLTYLYLVDANANQIYRYPRAEGGFGAPTNWLKTSLDLSQTSGLALSDNIFVASNNTLTKLFKSQKQDFTLEASATPIAPFKVYTKPDSQNIFILDKQNSRVVKIDPNGQIIFQFYNSEIGSATDFTVDEVNNTAYISTAGEIKSFSIN
ncbi:MAG: hypothetical protein WC238_03995 [Parcubacteria group bacterium]|jgi:hypothetical protein